MTADQNAFRRTTEHRGLSALPVFGYGFRPFFLGAGVYAIASVATWLAILAGISAPGAGDPVAWHAHEMLYGFAGAAIAGFLLTAVPNWTGGRGYAGTPLVLLTGLWLTGRVLMSPLLAVPPALAAVMDVAFFPALAALVLSSIIRARNKRNYVFLAMVALLTIGSGLHHADRLGLVDGGADLGRRLALGVVLLMVTLIGGRIIPSFTSSTLRRLGLAAALRPAGRRDQIALALTAGLLVSGLLAPDSRIDAAVALAAGLAHAARLHGWQGWAARRDPILGILHVAYLWIPVGLLLRAVSGFNDAAVGQGWTHALTLGCFSTMILAVMTRAALGHTGREIAASPAVVVAYAAVTLAAVARVFGPGLVDPAAAHAASGLLWTLAFGLFMAAYAPILLSRRADGRPG